MPRVGISTLGAILKNRGYECDLWFQSMPGFNEECLKEYDIVGISSITNTIPEAYRLADSLRQNGVIVVMGGPHVTFMPEEALDHCDYVVIGEGDVSFPDLIDALEKRKLPEGIPGLAYWLQNGDMHFTEPDKIVDYMNIPSPDFSLSSQIKSGQIPPIVVTSRGCPHDCTFCIVTSIFGRRYRFKRNEQVIAELRPILNKSVFFGDDNFFANPARTKALLRDMISQKSVPKRWSAQMTVKAAFDEEFLSLMEETHCRMAYIGIESVSPETLKRFNKAHDVKATERCIDLLHNHNIGVHGMFVLDIGDDVNAARDIVDFAIATDLDTIQIFCLTPFPGTTAYDEHQYRLLHREWKYFDGMHVVAEPLRCSAYDMQMAIVNEMQRFYSLKRVAGAYRRGRSWRVKYRAGGHYLIRTWMKENSEYLMRLRDNFYHKGRSSQIFPAIRSVG
jgi:radical SAM superfamily enzyme YgiQ (UPF0313 family)